MLINYILFHVCQYIILKYTDTTIFCAERSLNGFYIYSSKMTTDKITKNVMVKREKGKYLISTTTDTREKPLRLYTSIEPNIFKVKKSLEHQQRLIKL